MFAHIRATVLSLRFLATTAALVALALVLTLALSTPVHAAVPAQRQDSSTGMGGDMAGMGMMAATPPISTSMNMAEMGQMMTEMGTMMTEMGTMMASMPMTGTMSMDDMGKMMGMMGMMHMKMGQMQAMMACDMGMMGEGMMGGDKADATPAAPAATATPAVTDTVPAPTVTPEPEAEAEAPVDNSNHGAPAMVPAAQKSVAGAITVEVTPLATDDVLDVAFAVSLDTHSVDLSFDLAARATLIIGDAKFAATAWEPETVGGHHVPGILRFTITESAYAGLLDVSEVVLELDDIDGQLVTLTFPLGAN